MRKFDVFVIGSGMAGMTIANKCASKGLTVGVTDELPYGGTCALRGCDPKRVLIGVSEAADFASKLKGKGINGSLTLKWSDAMAFKKDFTDNVPSGVEERYTKKGVVSFHSSAEFVSENQLRVGDEIIEAGKIAIATGAKPRLLNIPGEEYALDSTDFLNLQRLPVSLLFIGGGYIAFEFAHLAARFGSKVTIVHKDPSPLRKFDQYLVEHLIAATKAVGINIVLETEVTEIRKGDNSFTVIGKSKEETKKLYAKAVFNTSGRTPAIEDLRLEAGKVTAGKEGVKVNEYLQSISNPAVYAAGDAAAPAHSHCCDGRPYCIFEYNWRKQENHRLQFRTYGCVQPARNGISWFNRATGDRQRFICQH